jgi:protein TonB
MQSLEINSGWEHRPVTITKWWQRSMWIALILSVLVHLGVLIFKKPPIQKESHHLKAPLAVVLLNSQSRLAPVKPKKLAQHNLNGGGQLETPIDATSISPMLPGINEKLQNLQQEQNRLLSSLRDDGSQSQKTTKGKATQEQEYSDPLEAELAKRIELQSQRPRKATFTSTSAKSVVYAEYINSLRNKVEAYGTKYFPRKDGQPLYGSLIIMISINKDGKILGKPTIEKSSGNSELDRQTLAIVQAASPFEKFSTPMLAQLDVIDWIATFEYVGGGMQPQLELRMKNPKQ